MTRRFLPKENPYDCIDLKDHTRPVRRVLYGLLLCKHTSYVKYRRADYRDSAGWTSPAVYEGFACRKCGKIKKEIEV